MDEEKPIERILLHDANNKLAVIIGYQELLMSILEQSTGNKIEDKDKFMIRLRKIGVSAQELDGIIKSLQGAYQIKSEGGTPVDGSKLSPNKTPYYVAHVDDEPDMRNIFSMALVEGSNTIQGTPGVFGHDGKKIMYKVYSFEIPFSRVCLCYHRRFFWGFCVFFCLICCCSNLLCRKRKKYTCSLNRSCPLSLRLFRNKSR